MNKRIDLSFFIIVLLPILMLTAAFIGFFLLFRSRIELDYGVRLDNMPDALQHLILLVIVLIIVVLILTGLILNVLIYKNITQPLRNLAAATRKIRDGELDFTVREEGPEEVQELCRDFEEMRVRLKEASEAQVAFDRESKELISNISHDLRTPIASIKGYVEGIMDGVADTPEKMNHYLRTIHNKAEEMDNLISELTFYSKIDTNRIPYAFASISVKDFFDDAAEDIGLELAGENVAFSYENTVAPDTKIIADAEQIRRVISNIVSNSLKYMDKPERKMAMRVKDAGDFVRIGIRDNGRGIAKKDLANIFNRFYRADTSRNTQGGSGIGLSIVRKIIEDHGGRVYAQSTQGKETTIYFELRKYEETHAAEEKAVRSRKKASKKGTAKKSREG